MDSWSSANGTIPWIWSSGKANPSGQRSSQDTVSVWQVFEPDLEQKREGERRKLKKKKKPTRSHSRAAGSKLGQGKSLISMCSRSIPALSKEHHPGGSGGFFPPSKGTAPNPDQAREQHPAFPKSPEDMDQWLSVPSVREGREESTERTDWNSKSFSTFNALRSSKPLDWLGFFYLNPSFFFFFSNVTPPKTRPGGAPSIPTQLYHPQGFRLGGNLDPRANPSFYFVCLWFFVWFVFFFFC